MFLFLKYQLAGVLYTLKYFHMNTYWSFIEKSSVKQDIKCKVFKFSDILFALKSDGPPVDEALGQVDIFVRFLGQADLWSDVPPVEASTGQEWYYFRSGWPLVRCTPSRGI